MDWEERITTNPKQCGGCLCIRGHFSSEVHHFLEHGLAQGDVGVAVHVYAGDAAYEVEFVTGEGTTVAVVTLQKESVRSMRQREILHVRDMAA